MRLGKIVATGIAEDVLDASVEESLPATGTETETSAEAADAAVAAPVPAQAGSSVER